LIAAKRQKNSICGLWAELFAGGSEYCLFILAIKIAARLKKPSWRYYVLSVFNAQSLTSAFLNFTAKATGKM
jgi:hypothetical protein